MSHRTLSHPQNRFPKESVFEALRSARSPYGPKMNDGGEFAVADGSLLMPLKHKIQFEAVFKPVETFLHLMDKYINNVP